jgi:hypothetical protein
MAASKLQLVVHQLPLPALLQPAWLSQPHSHLVTALAAANCQYWAVDLNPHRV